MRIKQLGVLFGGVLLLFGGRLDAEEVYLKSVLVTLIDQAEFSAAVEGPLAKVHVKEGDMVKPGDRLAELRDVDARLAVAQTKLNLRSAQRDAENDLKLRLATKTFEIATARLKRALVSVERVNKSVSESELERLKLDVDKAELDILQAKHDLETSAMVVEAQQNEVKIAEENLQQRLITSSIGGVVEQVTGRAGEWVKPGDSVVRVLRIDRLRVEGFIRLEELPKRLEGRQVVVTIRAGEKEREFYGRVTFVSRELNPVNQQFRVWAEIENRGLALRPGLQGKMVIKDAPPEEEPAPGEQASTKR